MDRPGGNALILAAGRGSRLLPVTDFIPKPLFPVLDSAALERITGILAVPEIDITAINTFHLKDRILKWSRSATLKNNIRILEEEELLGTGGAVKNAFENLGYDRPLLVYNADIICNLDPYMLMEQYFRSGCPAALLCVHNRPSFNKLEIRKDRILSFNRPGPAALAYTGISMISPELLRDVALRPCSLVEIWTDAIKGGADVKAVRGERLLRAGDQTWIWEDIGTPCGYLEGNWMLLGSMDRNLISCSAVIGRSLQLEGKVIIGNRAEIGDNTRIKDSVIWPGARINKGARIENCTVTPYGMLCCRDRRAAH